MPDRVNAVVNAMQPPARDASLDHAMCQPDFEQLRYGHNTVLTGSEGGDREVETTPLRATGLKYTYAVDFPPEAAHGPIVGAETARFKAPQRRK